MLTDILAYRYLKYPVWSQYIEAERRPLNQTIELAMEIYPVFDSTGKKVKSTESKWKSEHNRLARELGVNERSQLYYSFVSKGPMGQDWHQSGYWTYDGAKDVEQSPRGSRPSNDVLALHSRLRGRSQYQCFIPQCETAWLLT